MIISITGKPCSGKSTVALKFAEKHGFELLSMGDVFRKYSLELGVESIAKFNEDERIKQVDAKVDGYIAEVGKKRADEDIVIVSRTAWFLIPHSFKVFLDIEINEAVNRLIAANRTSEKVQNKREAKKALTDRWNSENKRYQLLYGYDNTNLNNYDLVISTEGKTVDEIVDLIFKNYKKFIKSSKK